MARIAVSISHEADYAVAIAFGVRTAGGRFLFPPDIEERLDDRERRLLARMERLRALHERVGAGSPTAGRGGWLTGAGRLRAARGRRAERDDRARRSRARSTLDDAAASALLPERPKRGHKGAFGKLLVIAGSLDYAGAALLVCRAAGRAGAGLVTLAVPESLQPLFAAKVVEATTMALPEDDVEEVEPEPALARILDHEHDALVVGPGLRPGLATAELVRAAPRRRRTTTTPPPIVLDAEALRSLATMDALVGGRPPAGRADAARRRVRAAAGRQRPRSRRRRRPRRRRRRPGDRGRATPRRRGARSSSSRAPRR